MSRAKRLTVIILCVAKLPSPPIAARAYRTQNSDSDIDDCIAANAGQDQRSGLLIATKNRMLFRTSALTVAGAGTLFWIYTFYGIAQVPSGDGSGFQWLGVMPLGLIFFALTVPALLLALSGRLLWLSLVLGCTGLVAFAIVWNQLLSEFYH